MTVVLETDRLILRPVTMADAQDFLELDSNPNVHRYLGNNPVTSIYQSKSMILNVLEQYDKYGLGRLAIIEKNNNAFIGWSGIKYETQVRKEFNYYDLGYRLKEQFWGNGYATEAALASLDFGFNDLNLREIAAAADVNNIASNMVLKKIGMIPSGNFTFENELCNWYTLENPNSNQK